MIKEREWIGMASRKNNASLRFVLPFLVLLAFSACVQAISIGGVAVNDQPYYSPYPAEPGKYIDLWARIEYPGTVGEADNITCAIVPSFPFSIELGDEAEKFVGTLSPYQDALLKFRVRIDQNAVSGYNKLKFGCKTSSIEWTYTDFDIYVQAQDAVLSVGNVVSSPDEFEAGQTGDLTITLSNIAAVGLKDITVKLDLTSADIPFAPVGSTIEKRIDNIGTGESANVSFGLVAFSDAASKVYKIPLTLTYYDALGKEYDKSTILSLIVANKPNLMAVFEQTQIVKNGTMNKVIISISNIGLTQVKFLTASVDDTSDYQLLSQKQLYIGSINSDDSETAEFDLFIKRAGTITIPLTLTFQDASGNSYTQQKNVAVRVYTDEEAVRLGLVKAIPIDPLILGLVAIIAIYVIYRAYRFTTRKK